MFHVPLLLGRSQDKMRPGCWHGTQAEAVVSVDRGQDSPSEHPRAVARDGGGAPRKRRLVDAGAAARNLGVLIGSDDPFTRRAFRSGASAPGIEVLAEGTVTAVAEQMAASLEPDIVVLDVQTAAARALRAIQQIRARAPRTRILACSTRRARSLACSA